MIIPTTTKTDQKTTYEVDGSIIKYPDGRKFWYLNGKPHRVDGPAIELPGGYYEYYLNGERHRVDGPAAEYPSGIKRWYLNGKLRYEEDPVTKCPGEKKLLYPTETIMRYDELYREFYEPKYEIFNDRKTG